MGCCCLQSFQLWGRGQGPDLVTSSSVSCPHYRDYRGRSPHCEVDWGSSAHTLYKKPFTPVQILHVAMFQPTLRAFQKGLPHLEDNMWHLFLLFWKGVLSLSHDSKRFMDSNKLSVHNIKIVWKVFFTWPESNNAKRRWGVRGERWGMVAIVTFSIRRGGAVLFSDIITLEKQENDNEINTQNEH